MIIAIDLDDNRLAMAKQFSATTAINHHDHRTLGGYTSTTMVLNILRSNKIDAKLLITHRFVLDHSLDAYETFGNAVKTKALKVIIQA